MEDRLVRGSACLGSVPPGSLAERTDGRRLEGASSWAQMSVHGGRSKARCQGTGCKPAAVAVTAMARELAGFVWAEMTS